MALVREPEFLPDWYRRRLARSRRRRHLLLRLLVVAAVVGTAAAFWPDAAPVDAAVAAVEQP
jgi:hypothetical protein